jgi:hypothetical protein
MPCDVPRILGMYTPLGHPRTAVDTGGHNDIGQTPEEAEKMRTVQGNNPSPAHHLRSLQRCVARPAVFSRQRERVTRDMGRVRDSTGAATPTFMSDGYRLWNATLYHITAHAFRSARVGCGCAGRSVHFRFNDRRTKLRTSTLNSRTNSTAHESR